MTYLEHLARHKLARTERVGIAYRWLGALGAAATLWLVVSYGS